MIVTDVRQGALAAFQFDLFEQDLRRLIVIILKQFTNEIEMGMNQKQSIPNGGVSGTAFLDLGEEMLPIGIVACRAPGKAFNMKDNLFGIPVTFNAFETHIAVGRRGVLLCLLRHGWLSLSWFQWPDTDRGLAMGQPDGKQEQRQICPIFPAAPEKAHQQENAANREEIIKTIEGVTWSTKSYSCEYEHQLDGINGLQFSNP